MAVNANSDARKTYRDPCLYVLVTKIANPCCNLIMLELTVPDCDCCWAFLAARAEAARSTPRRRCLTGRATVCASRRHAQIHVQCMRMHTQMHASSATGSEHAHTQTHAHTATGSEHVHRHSHTRTRTCRQMRRHMHTHTHMRTCMHAHANTKTHGCMHRHAYAIEWTPLHMAACA